MTDIKTKINDLKLLAQAFAKTVLEVEAMVNAAGAQPAVKTVDSLLSSLTAPQQEVLGETPAPDAPAILVDVALWQKEKCFSGKLTLKNPNDFNAAPIAEYNLVLFRSKPNSDCLVLNGYIRDKNDNNSNGSLHETSVGSIYVYNNQGVLESRIKIEPSQVNNLFSCQVDLAPVTKTTENSPDLKGKVTVNMHFYSMAVRAKLAAAGANSQQAVSVAPNPLDSLFPSSGAPTDGGILTNPMNDINALLG